MAAASARSSFAASSHELDDFYAVDLMCDPELQPFYERFGMHRATGMIIRRR